MTLQSKYSIVRKIADGGTAEIFLAKQHGAQGFEKGVVLKRIFTEFYADPQFRHMLVDEAHIAMSLNHSNIVQVLDLGEEEGRYFLALELVDGWTLDAVLRRAKTAGIPFPPPLALYVTAEVCRALAYAHAKLREGVSLGIVHRDVSPHNVLVSEHGEVKLTDFGIAKAAIKREQSLGNTIKGKIAFMSPEQAAGGDIDARSDLFSLGTMLYVMITRHYPFDAPTDFETLMQVKSGDFLPPETARPGLNPELYRVIRKAMGKAPVDRYQKAEEMLVDVEQVMRLAFRPVGQTELVRWLSELAEKDGAAPLTRQVPTSADSTPGGGRNGSKSASHNGALPTAPAQGVESGLSIDLNEAELVTPPERPRPPPFSGPTTPPLSGPVTVGPVVRTTPAKLRFRGVALTAALVTVALVALGVAGKSCGAHDVATPAAAPMASAPARAPATPPPGIAATPPAPAIEPPPAAAPEPTPPPPEKVETSPSGATAEAEKEKDRTAEKTRTDRQVAVVVKSDPDGAKVSSRHHAYGTTPVTVRLRPGHTYVLTLAKPGFAPSITRYFVESNAGQSVHVTLKKTGELKKAAAANPAGPSSSPSSAAPRNAKPNWWKFSR
jgi:serine/threonine protein kinase